MSEQEYVIAGFAKLLGEYREVAERIVKRHDHHRYVLVRDRDRLAHLNNQVASIRAYLTDITQASGK